MIAIIYNKGLQRINTIVHGTIYYDRAYSIGVDSQDNVILAGSGYSGHYFTDMYLAKYDSTANKLWAKFLYGTYYLSEITGKNMVVMPDDSFWIVGSDATNTNSLERLYIGHYDKDGNLIKDKFIDPYPGKYDFDYDSKLLNLFISSSKTLCFFFLLK